MKPRIVDRIKAVGNAIFGRSIAPFDADWYGNGLPHFFKPKESLDVYGDNAWLYSAVNVIASEIARTDFKLAIKQEDGLEYIENHQALDLLKRPQPIKGGKSMLTGMDLKLITTDHLLLNGEAFWLKTGTYTQTGAPAYLDPLLPEYMKVDVGKNGEVIKYVYDTNSKTIDLDPLDVVHFRMPDPRNWYRGHAPTKSIRYSLDSHKEADTLNFNRLARGAVPSGILSTDGALTEMQMKQIRDDWQTAYGGGKNAGKTPILPKGITWQQIQESNAEMQWVEGKEVTRDEILANYRVGLEMLGKTESQTRANAEASIFTFMRFGILPLLEKYVDTLNNDYLVMFPEAEELEFVFDDPVPENLEEKRLNIQTLMDNAAMTPDEARISLGLEPLEQAGVTDIPYISFNKVPAGQPPPAEVPLG